MRGALSRLRRLRPGATRGRRRCGQLRRRQELSSANRAERDQHRPAPRRLLPTGRRSAPRNPPRRVHDHDHNNCLCQDCRAARFLKVLANSGSSGIYAQMDSYGDILREYRMHPEHKFNGPDGQPCRGNTRGLLQRRPVHSLALFGLLAKKPTTSMRYKLAATHNSTKSSPNTAPPPMITSTNE
jgi:hypothetical protein